PTTPRSQRLFILRLDEAFAAQHETYVRRCGPCFHCNRVARACLRCTTPNRMYTVPCAAQSRGCEAAIAVRSGGDIEDIPRPTGIFQCDLHVRCRSTVRPQDYALDVPGVLAWRQSQVDGLSFGTVGNMNQCCGCWIFRSR